MGKLKLIFAIGLCMLLLALPLTGMAENPLPVGHNADGHPWDDNSGENDSPGLPADTTKTVDVPVARAAYPGGPGDKPSVSFLRFALTGKWYFLLR